MATQAMNQQIKGLEAQCQALSSSHDLNKDHRAKFRQLLDDNAQELQKLI